MKISDEVFISTWLMVVVEVKCVECGDLGSEGDAADFILVLKCTSLSRKDIMTDSKNGLQVTYLDQLPCTRLQELSLPGVRPYNTQSLSQLGNNIKDLLNPVGR